MINVTDLRAGATFLQEGKPYIVLKYEHKKVGRGNAVIKTQVKNLKTGSIEEKGFTSGGKVEEISTVRRQLQYLYKDGLLAYFMDPKNFEQIEILLPVIADQIVYVKEGESINVLFWENEALSVDLPPNVVMTVAQTDPGVKGNSATNIFKSGRLENGLTVKIPLFINTGEKIRVDTRTGEYIERAKDS
jgi:elongation factor P